VISRPENLSAEHVLDGFDCGQPSLNQWLKKRAHKANLIGHSARVYVVCDALKRVVGYYALSTGSVTRVDAPGRVTRNMPEPIPVVVLGRLAVDQAVMGQGIGSGLLKDALLRIAEAAEHIGIRAVLVHALNEPARSFYLKHGFYDSPTDEMALMLTVEEIRRLF